MKPINLSELSDQALAEEAKKQKKSIIAFRILLGFLAGIAIYSATHKGSFIIACLPLFFISTSLRLDKNYKAIKTEIELRKNKIV
jgi:hypothetical protein